MQTSLPINKPVADPLLPAEVSADSGTWLYRYRNYPVFSRAWFRYRTFAYAGVHLITLLISAAIYFLSQADWQKFFVAAFSMSVGAALLYTLGQAFAVFVRLKNWPKRKEGVGLVVAIMLGAVLSYGVFEVTRYTTKLIVYGDGNTRILLTLYGPDTLQKNSVAEPPPKPPNLNELAAGESWAERTKFFLALIPFLIVFVQTGSGFDLWLFFRQRRKLEEAMRLQELSREQNARREAELRLSVLVAQVEPHFLFNTLAGVRSAIQTEPQRATAIIDHLVDYLRATIPQMRNDGSTVQGRLTHQLDAARSYLALMQARIPRLSFNVKSTLSDAALPPLMLISLVENAIKHGVEPKIGPVHIDVLAQEIRQDGEAKLEVSVTDNGAGFGSTSSGSGIGLANIRERLESMYGARASLNLKARADGGIAAVIVLPLGDSD